MRAPLITGVLCFLSASGGVYAEQLTLEEAIRLAESGNRELKNATLDSARAGERVSAFRSHLLPQLTFSVIGSQLLQPVTITFQPGLFGIYPGIGPVPPRETQQRTPLRPVGITMARVVQPLSTLHRLHLNLNSLQIGRLIAEEQVRARRQELVRNVKRVYFSLQQANASLRSVRAMTALYREIDRLTRDYVRQAAVLKGDAIEVEMRLGKAEQSELAVANQEAAAKEQLNQLMGRDVLTEFTVAGVSELSDVVEMDIQAARDRALHQRPEVRQAALKRSLAAEEVRSKRAEYIPDVALELNSINLTNFNQGIPAHFNMAGLTLSWEPFDWGRKRHELADKRYAVEQADNVEKDARNMVLLDVDDKFRQLQLARGQLRVSDLAREASTENLRVAGKRYEVRAVLLREVLQAQASLEQAQADYQQALLGFWNARSDFERALGEEQ